MGVKPRGKPSSFAQQEPSSGINQRPPSAVPRARKSLGASKKPRRQLETKGSLPADDPEKHWEIDRFGPIFLSWSERYLRNEKGKITGKRFTIKRQKVSFRFYSRRNTCIYNHIFKNHLIWVKWKQPFAGTDVYWSAEPQGSINYQSFSTFDDFSLKRY